MTQPLDPLIALAVGIATSPRSYAFLLGSGVSLEAGVPSGEQILRTTLERLYRVEHDGDHEPTREELEHWLGEQGLTDATYANVLERAFPAQQSRRDFLAAFFAGRSPGPTHHALARLASDGLIRVFLTTNFDPLLEDALRAAGLQPIVASDAATLESVPSRETADVFVLKLHGDVTQLNIRNTPPELEQLEPRMEQELAEISERYGIVTLGYAGRDAAVARAVSSTSPRFGLYWLSRSSELNADAQRIVDAAAGRVIVRAGAADFATELERRIQLWAAHPTGATPTTVRAEMIDRLRARDGVGVQELAAEERRQFETNCLEVITAAADDSPGPTVDTDRMRRLERELVALLERRLASVLPLIEYDTSAVEEEARWLAEFAVRELPARYSYSAWIQAPRWPAWMLLWAMAAVAVVRRRFEVFAALWRTQSIYYDAEPLGAMRLLGAAELGQKLEIARFGKSLRLDGFWHLAALLSASDLVQTHYPDLLRGEYGDSLLGTLGHLGDASYVFAALGGRDGIDVIKLWPGPQVSALLPVRLESDRHLQQRLAQDLFDVPADEVVTRVREWVKNAPGPDV